jgi:hypothetical protein
MNGRAGNDTQWIRESMKNGMPHTILELVSCVVVVANLPGVVKRMAYGMRKLAVPYVKNVPAMRMLSVMAYSVSRNNGKRGCVSD